MKIKNWFWGIFFIVAAAIVIVNQLGYFTSINLFSLTFSVLLVSVIIKSAIHLNFPGILFPIALLCIIFAKPLGITALTPWPILITALFASIGFSLIFHKKHNYHCNHKGENFEEVVNTPDGNIVNFRVSFGSSIKYVNTDNFQKGNLGCSFGALKVYFDNAKINPEGAEIYLDVSFAGVEIYIPSEWKVINNANVTLGGLEEKNSRREHNGPILELKGNVSFSGIEIIYV